jgi:AraC family transcriptional regulator
MPAQASMLRTAAPSTSEVLGMTENISVSLISDAHGLVEFTGSPRVIVSIHVGPSVYSCCRRLGETRRGTTVHGDVDVIPPRVPGSWELKGTDTALVMGLHLRLLHRVAEESGADPRQLEIRNRFQVRDPQIEHIGWAFKEEMESGYPCGRLYLDGLATSLAARIVTCHSSFSRLNARATGGIPSRRLREVLSFIEENLHRDLALREIAESAGLGVSHFGMLFRRSMGLSVHQYLIRRRVERASWLLRKGKLSIGEAALETGFCHQSHLALHMRRILGISPRELKNGGT